MNVVEGQEEPEIQGWYSEEYNKYEPNKAVIFLRTLAGENAALPMDRRKIDPDFAPDLGRLINQLESNPEQIHLRISQKRNFPSSGKTSIYLRAYCKKAIQILSL